MKHLSCKLCYRQLHLTYLCNLAKYCLQAPWRWHDSVETCRSVVICEVIVRLLVIVQNTKKKLCQFPLSTWTCRWKDKILCLPTSPSALGLSCRHKHGYRLNGKSLLDADTRRNVTSIPPGTSDGVLLCAVRLHVTSSFRTPRHVPSFSGVVTHTLVNCNSVLTRITSKNHAYISLITLPLLAAGWSAVHSNMSAFYGPLTSGAHGTTFRHNDV